MGSATRNHSRAEQPGVDHPPTQKPAVPKKSLAKNDDGLGVRSCQEVLGAEWHEIRKRRAVSAKQLPTGVRADNSASGPPSDLTGLALSGGGIRSATFCLGLLQGLDDSRLFRHFDYLSTVSGGGYVGAWLTAWQSRRVFAEPLERKDLPDDPIPRDLEDLLRYDDCFKRLVCTGIISDAQLERLLAMSGPPGFNAAVKRLYDRPRRAFPPRESSELSRAPHYLKPETASIPESAMAADHDPVHHLRLFGNYLTPKKGMFGADAWLALTVVARNLLLTWLVLIPLFASVILLAQLWFVPTLGLRLNAAGAVARIEHAMYIPLFGLGALASLMVAWLVGSGGSGSRSERFASLIGTAAALLLALCLWESHDFNPVALRQQFLGHFHLPTTLYRAFVWGALSCLVVVAYHSLRFGTLSGQDQASLRRMQDVWRNTMTRAAARLLAVVIVATVALLIAGCSYDLIHWLRAGTSTALRSGRWITGALAVATAIGSLATALRASPKGGAELRDGSQSRRSLVWMAAIACPAALLFLGIGLSALTAMMVRHVIIPAETASSTEVTYSAKLVDSLTTLHVTALVGVIVCFTFAVFEMKWRRLHFFRKTACSLCVFAVSIGWVTSALAAYLKFMPGYGATKLTHPALLITPLILALLSFGLILSKSPALTIIRRVDRNRSRSSSGRVLRLVDQLVGMVGIALVSGIGLYFATKPLIKLIWSGANGSETPPDTILAVSAGLGGLLLCGSFLVLDQLWGKRRARSLVLLGFSILVLVGLVFAPHNAQLNSSDLVDAPDHVSQLFFHVTAGLFVVSVAWVVALGWMTDPNLLSVHEFYRARLVRAYLGASNAFRATSGARIGRSVEGDDLPLKDVDSCSSGGPYHLINATLNLVGASDLAASQRSAEPFLLSRLFCGSLRTGFRATDKYMGGCLSLGAAVAISGAAASPNMGSKTPTSALAMLMTFLNVRLGFWAPTPNRPDWRSSQPRLWPIYVLQEFLSRTNDLTRYSYLTDGGHFDNTGLYSLVARGCRFIVVADCGADPNRHFADLGDAFRRCAIDFGTRFEFDLDPLGSPEKPAKKKYALGRFYYTDEHLGHLGEVRRAGNHLDNHGIILVIKPAFTDDRIVDRSVDVRQYNYENPRFPQQSTAEQWFDEAQFESYRHLGELTARELKAAFQVASRGTKRATKPRGRSKTKSRASHEPSLGELLEQLDLSRPDAERNESATLATAIARSGGPLGVTSMSSDEAAPAAPKRGSRGRKQTGKKRRRKSGRPS